MGSLSDNGGLPDLPEEWGVIVIPDDLSELSAEVTTVREELRREQRTTRWRRLFDHRGLRTLRRLGAASVRAPVLIISMAVLVTIASLFASAWPGPARSPATQRTASTSDDDTATLPALDLRAADGQTVSLRAQLPAVVLLTDGCDCADLIAATTTAVRPDIAVVTVESGKAPATTTAQTPPTSNTPQAQGKTVRVLRDPTSSLRSNLRLGTPDGTAAVLLVDRTGEVVRKIPRTKSVNDYEPDLARL
ncbi:hypothetical protein [Actinoplanes sp. N902-109]|uniref:hypothetical protein n=1 Tax=Actinoplanes sp. (strain N902-109) TaxID=649831 RepID=UPI0003295B30|nr:hypothetical protein [Actinoplanes sp. N902-109]AGL21349.1 hypothetical protein L083_7839 [Actinoplanes sp. N902-109]